MTVYNIQAPNGQIFNVEGDSPPTEQELEQIFAQMQPQQQVPSGLEPGGGVNDRFLGMAKYLEPAATVATSMVAEPLAGLAGIAQTLNPFAPEGAGEKAVEATRQALTFTPKTEEGFKGLQSFGEFVQPVADIFKKAEEATGRAGESAAGPLGGALGETIPTAALSFLGVGPLKRSIKAPANLIKSKNLIKTAVPSVDELKTAAKAVYQQIDDAGAIVKGGKVRSLTGEFEAIVAKEGLPAETNATLRQAIGALKNNPGGVNVTYLDSVRRSLGDMRASLVPSEKRLGEIFTDKIDDFMNSLKSKDFAAPTKADIGPLYHDARQLWQRAKKGDLIGEAIENARHTASGFENGLRIEFRKIIKNPKKRRGFTQEELSAMRAVEEGTTLANMAKRIGKMGFGEGQATNYIGSSIAGSLGYAIGGGPGAAAAVGVGQLSKIVAQKVTLSNAKFAESLALAGGNGKKIIDAYMRAVPKKNWNSAELGALISDSKTDLKALQRAAEKAPKDTRKLYLDGIFMAEFLRGQQNGLATNQ